MTQQEETPMASPDKNALNMIHQEMQQMVVALLIALSFLGNVQKYNVEYICIY